jgi:hypothetical protein
MTISGIQPTRDATALAEPARGEQQSADRPAQAVGRGSLAPHPKKTVPPARKEEARPARQAQPRSATDKAAAALQAEIDRLSEQARRINKTLMNVRLYDPAVATIRADLRDVLSRYMQKQIALRGEDLGMKATAHLVDLLCDARVSYFTQQKAALLARQNEFADPRNVDAINRIDQRLGLDCPPPK